MRSLLPCVLLLALSLACAGTRPSVATPAPHALQFIEDDYGRAVAVAQAKKLPIFVDIWAPW